MKRLLLLGMSATLCLSALPLHAQDFLLSTGQRGSVAAAATSDPAWFSTVIDIDFKNLSLIDAVKKILDAAKVKYERVEATLELPKTKFSLTVKSVNARDALAAMARFGGAQAYVSTEDGKTVVELRKRSNEATLRSTFPFKDGVFSGFPGASGNASVLLNNLRRTEAYKDLPDKTLEISITKGSALDIIKQIAQKTGLEYEIEDGLKSTRNNLSFTMKDVSVGGALDMAAQWLECGWKAEKKGETVKIYFSKKYPKPAGNMIFMPSMPPPASLPRSPSVGTTFPGLATMPFRSTLPNKKVSLDKVKTDPREALKEVLKQAGLSYAIGDDLPSDPKSFTFSDVSITTALDMICESIGASWSTERGPDGKSVVRIGKAHSRSR